MDFYESQIQLVTLSEIIIKKRVRSRIDYAQIESLAKSIKEIGLLNPITLTKDKLLIAGYHRLKACELLKWTKIPCVITTMKDPLKIRLQEIDENLIRAELTELEFGEHLAKRKKIYEKLYPESTRIEKVKTNLKQYSDNDKLSSSVEKNKTYTEDLAKKLKLSQRTIQRKTKIGNEISKEVRNEIRTTPIANRTTDLLKITKLNKKQQNNLLKKIKEKKTKNKPLKKLGDTIAQIKREEKLEELRKNQPEHQKVEFIPEIYCQKALEFLDSIEDRSQDLLFSDPPYMKDIHLSIDEFVNQWVPKALEKIKDSGRIFVFTGNYPQEIRAYINVFLNQKRFYFSNILIWTYKNTIGPSTNRKYKNNYQCLFYLYGREAPPLNSDLLKEKFSVMEFNAPDGRQANNFFKWQKPDDLAERIIRHSTQEGDRIIDPFAGSGTFLLKATEMKRYAKGSEIMRSVIDIAIKRGCVLKNDF